MRCAAEGARTLAGSHHFGLGHAGNEWPRSSGGTEIYDAHGSPVSAYGALQQRTGTGGPGMRDMRGVLEARWVGRIGEKSAIGVECRAARNGRIRATRRKLPVTVVAAVRA